MLRSLYSGISGMKNMQTKLDVIGNNIANVNTHGFKKSRITFKDTIYQTLQNAYSPDAGLGGINPKQVGHGSEIAGIDVIDTQGSFQSTGRVLDLAVSGDGFFIVEDGEGNEFYTRAGNFYIDADGYLVTSDGYHVLNPERGRIQVVPEGRTVENISIDPNGNINVIFSGSTTVEQRGTIGLATFSNPAGLERVGGNLFRETDNSGDANVTDGGGKINSGRLEMSNVDLAEEFTEMIVAQRGFQANTRIITTSDEILQELVNLKR